MTQEAIFSLYKDNTIFRDLLQDFVMNLQERLSLCQKAWDSQSWDELARAMHQWRGAAATYGYPGLSDIAGRIEDAVKQDHLSDIFLIQSMGEVRAACQGIVAGIGQT